MALLHNISIKNFRGIESFQHDFYSKDLICFIGRGDSGKTTILEAISMLLSPSWNMTFYDTDFYECKIESPIEITGTFIYLPEFFYKEPYAMHLIGFDPQTGNIVNELEEGHESAITIRLFIDKDLEPKWTVINERNDPISISATARSKMNVFLVSDYTDMHFTWSRGKPLNTLLRQEENTTQEEENNIIITTLREAKTKIDENSFEEFEGVVKKVRKSAKDLGIDISRTKTTLDFRDLSIRDNRVCLHDNNIPFRQKGKGSKRLISMAIQSIIADIGGVILIDEVEQGLEPDRVKHLVRTFERINTGQVFLTTHSQSVIEELKVDNLILLSNDDGECVGTECPPKFQDLVRACPEAMFANKVIVCEGKTELGICRSMDEDRIKNDFNSFSEDGVICVLGEGDNFISRAIKLNDLGMDVCVFCDSDVDDKLNPSKQDLIENDIDIFDCEKGYSIEQQFCNDLPWIEVISLVQYAIRENGEQSVLQTIENKLLGKLEKDWMNEDNQEMRDALGKAFKSKSWFKRIDHGTFLGDIYFKNENTIDDSKLYRQLTDIHNWIEG